jgi:hypothetical protein
MEILKKTAIVLSMGILCLAILAQSAEAQCFGCISCNPGHQVMGNPPAGVTSVDVHPCWSGTCYSSAHEECNFEEDEPLPMAQLPQIPAMSAEELIALLQKHPTQMFLNGERRAVQVWDCTKTVIIAHLPLPEEIFTAVEDG